MTTMWPQGDLIRALQQIRLADTETGWPHRPRTTRPTPVAGSLRPAPAR